MKTNARSSNQQTQHVFAEKGKTFLNSNMDQHVDDYSGRNYLQPVHSPRISKEVPTLLTETAAAEVLRGGIPNLEQVCRQLYTTFFVHPGRTSAMQFVPVLKSFRWEAQEGIGAFLENPRTNHVLVQNELLKVVLIRWEPGKFSSVHGHARGGCVFKVLQGRLEEKRFSPDEQKNLLAVNDCRKGSMAYIDDEMAYHAVGNPSDSPAISLHAYTPGF